MTIKVKGASENNLREIDALFSDGLTVVTGVSGSGKSSLARCFNHPHPVPLPAGEGTLLEVLCSISSDPFKRFVLAASYSFKEFISLTAFFPNSP